MKRLSLSLASLLILTSACSSDEPGQTSRSGYLFDLSEEDIEELHDAYLPDEPIEETFARLSAPFDCTQYDDLCEQVGRDAAIRITAQLVDLSLDGEDIEVIDTQLSEWLNEAMQAQANEEKSATDDWTPRSSGPWIRTLPSNGRQLRVRNGITTPVVGKRRAWTEAQFLLSDSNNRRNADVLCVNTGANFQEHTTFTSTNGHKTLTIENLNPGEVCFNNANSATSETRHLRRSGSEGHGIQDWYLLTAQGSARAFDRGFSYTVTGFTHSREY